MAYPGCIPAGCGGRASGAVTRNIPPIAESDFIYSVIGEELGFFGCVMVFYLILFAQGLRIAGQTGPILRMLLCLRLTTVTATQTFFNIGGVTKFIP